MAKMRPLVFIPEDHEEMIVMALEAVGEHRKMNFLELRAFIYILWDGVVLAQTVLALQLEEVLKDPLADKLEAVSEVHMKPCKENRYREISWPLSQRSQGAIEDLVKVLRRDRWIKRHTATGTLFVAPTAPSKGTGKRVILRTLGYAWRKFLNEHVDSRMDYTFHDFVFTGRMHFQKATGNDLNALRAYTYLGYGDALRHIKIFEETMKLSTRDLVERAQKSRGDS